MTSRLSGAAAQFFQIPKSFIITTPKYYAGVTAAGIFVAYSEVRSWGRVQQERGLVVVIELVTSREVSSILELDTIVAADGPWATQLDDVSSTPATTP